MALKNTSLFEKKWIKYLKQIECVGFNCSRIYEVCLRWKLKDEGLFLSARCWKCGKRLIPEALVDVSSEMVELWRDEIRRAFFRIDLEDEEHQVSRCAPGVYGRSCLGMNRLEDEDAES